MTPSFKGGLNVKRIQGTVGTGKTEALVDQALELLASGVSPRDIGIYCATPHAADAFSSRLAAKLGSPSSAVEATTPREAALALLSSREARTFTGRPPRVMADFEYSFLLEDMKVSGLRPQRLREMLKFFFRGWTELADDDPDWLFGEEVGLHALLKENLAFLQAMLEPEVANYCVRLLRSNEEALFSARVGHVLVDDYQCLSKASQVLTRMLASESLTIAGDPSACIEVYDSYPFAQGFEDLADQYQSPELVSLKTCWVAQSVCNVANNLLADSGRAPTPDTMPAASAPEGSVQAYALASAEEEYACIAELVSTLTKAGMAPDDIHLVAPNRTWSAALRVALLQKGIASTTLPYGPVLRGDIRDLERSAELRRYTALKLVANPRDALAWRCWCGYGDYLANSIAFDSLRALGKGQTPDAFTALERACDGSPVDCPGFEKVARAFEEGTMLIAEARKLRGRDLLEFLAARTSDTAKAEAERPGATPPASLPKKAAETPSSLLQLCAPVKDDDTAESLFARAEKNLIDPRFCASGSTVRISAARHLCGLSPKAVIFSGFVNGFLPSRDYFDSTVTSPDKQKKMHRQDVQLVYAAAGKAREMLSFTYFTREGLERAEQLKLEVERIRLEKGVPQCVIAPSELLALALPPV